MLSRKQALWPWKIKRLSIETDLSVLTNYMLYKFHVQTVQFQALSRVLSKSSSRINLRAQYWRDTPTLGSTSYLPPVRYPLALHEPKQSNQICNLWPTLQLDEPMKGFLGLERDGTIFSEEGFEDMALMDFLLPSTHAPLP